MSSSSLETSTGAEGVRGRFVAGTGLAEELELDDEELELDEEELELDEDATPSPPPCIGERT